MATAIHHGPPGSYKSFTLTQRFAIDALKQGRVVITNIRGFTSIDRIRDQFPDIEFPETADIWFINTDDKKYRQFMAGWFHWVPLGALVIIDECQRIYPNRRDFKKENLDKIDLLGFVPDDISVTIEDEYTGDSYVVSRPDNVDDAFDMQRHFNWDLYLSTPHINKVHDFMRQVCQAGYRHKSLTGKLPPFLSKILGFQHTWYEFQHDPENTGKSVTHIIGNPRKYTADERVFHCYQSTATGEHTESKADQSIFGDPKLRIFIAVLVLAIGSLVYLVSHRTPGFGVRPDDLQTPVSASPVPGSAPGKTQLANNQPDRQHTAENGSDTVGNGAAQQSPGFFDSLGYRLIQVTYQDTRDKQHDRLQLLADSDDGLIPVTYKQLFLSGVRASIHGLCNIKLIAPDGSILDIGCYAKQVRECSVSLETPETISRRNCYKYGEEKKRSTDPVDPGEGGQLPIPSNAIVATAQKLVE